MYSKNILVLGDPNSREAQHSQATCEEEEKELLREAIALSLEENNEEDEEKEEDNEEELLKEAIALSLEAGDWMWKQYLDGKQLSFNVGS